MNTIGIEQAIPSVAPDILGYFFGFPISNDVLLSFLITIIFILFGIWFKRRISMVPGRAQSLIEIMYDQIAELVDQVTGKREISERILPLIGSLFVYIATANLITVLPGLTSITYGGVAIFRTPTSALNTTLALAFAMIVLTQMVSIRDWGFWGHIGKYIQIKGLIEGFKKGIGPGFFSVIEFLVGLLDIVSETARVVSLSLRLFGNMYAGEVLLVILMAAVAYVVPVLWLGLSIFFGLVQAVVFGALVAAYYTLALKQEEVGNS
ncbi:MAG: F0F1 ATP synthase subunit A [bacterium]|nr:F0F1 ATP synthase subunit A [bacterium]